MKRILILIIMILSLISCNTNQQDETAMKDDFSYFADQFDDIRILKYKLPGFEDLSLQQKEFIWYLSQASIAGRDIFWDQNFRFNLKIRKTIEGVIDGYSGSRDNDEYNKFLIYAKKVFFANGIHHHYSNDKFIPEFSETFFAELIRNTPPGKLPLAEGMTSEALVKELTPILFNPVLYAKRAEQSAGIDIVAGSATNFYEDVTQEEAEMFYEDKISKDDPRPVSTGLNSKLARVNGKVTELVYKSGGLYGLAIDSIIFWLDKASLVAENEQQKDELRILIDYYKTGDLKIWDDYNVAWARNTDPLVDYINGFIETYDDPLGMKAAWEGIVNYKDIEGSKRTAIVMENAQWFEDNAPIQPEYKKEKVTGINAKVINIAMLGGATYPASPIGINLPNADWIRKEVGSKSVTLANISDAYENASRNNGFLEEFAASEDEVNRIKKYGSIAGALHTDLHECIGHASGKLAPGTDPNALKNYGSSLEETRAELFALYFMKDKKITDLKLLPDEEAGNAEYDHYIRNGLLTQLVRIQPGKNIEQAHMRARSIIARWVYEKGKPDNVVEMFRRDDKTYVRINDYRKVQSLFGELLKEIQRVKSEGDFEAGRDLVENYGVKIDTQLHKEALDRFARLKLAPYTGFINPYLFPKYDENGKITDIVVEYTDDYLGQMMYYGKNYSFLK